MNTGGKRCNTAGTANGRYEQIAVRISPGPHPIYSLGMAGWLSRMIVGLHGHPKYDYIDGNTKGQSS